MKNGTVWKICADVLKRNFLRVIGLIALCVLGAILPCVSPLIYREIVDELIPQKNMNAMYMYILVMIAIPILTSVVLNMRNVCAFQVSDRITITLRKSLFQKILDLQNGELSRFGVSTLVYRITRSCGEVGSVFLNGVIISLVNAVFTLIMVLTPMCLLAYRLAIMVFLAFPIVYVLLNAIKKRVYIKDKALMDVLMEGERLIYESMGGIRAIKLFGGQRKHNAILDGWLGKHTDAKLDSTKIHEFERVTLPELCMQVLYGMIFLYGAYLVMQDAMSIGTLVAFVAYIPRALSSIKELLSLQMTFKSVEPVVGSLEEVLDAECEKQGELPVKSGSGDIVFENVGFAYDGGSGFGLTGMDFKIAGGEAVALVGETGSGKSTILDLLLRFYEPDSGRILLDGRNIQEYDLDSYRAQFSVVQQLHYLWGGTLKSNVIYPDEEADEQAYTSAIKRAQLQALEAALPQGEATVIGECGQAVSGGERQRIGVANALYRDGDILILDEPTASLDAHTAAMLKNVFLEQKGKKTIITVTHSLSTIMQYDRVIVLKEGRIIEEGSPCELIGQESKFREMCIEQGMVI